MTRPRILTALFALCILAAYVQPAAAHYDPKLGRWLERDPLGTLVSNPMAEVLRQQEAAGSGAAPSYDELPWAEMLSRFDFDPPSQYDDGSNLYQYGWSDPLGGMDPAGGPWWTVPLRAAGRPLGVAAGGAVGRAIGKQAAKATARRIAQHQAQRKARKISKCLAVYATYKALKCKSCTGITDPVELGKRAACFAAEIAGRRKYLDLRCDWHLPDAVAAGSRATEARHKRELANKLRAAATCATQLANCRSTPATATGPP